MSRQLAGSLHSFAETMAAERKAQRNKVEAEKKEEGVITTSDLVDAVTFAEAKWGLGLKLWPAQRVVLKCYYNIPLDNTKKYIPIREYPKEEIIDTLTEKEFVSYLRENGHTNVDPDNLHKAMQLVLVMGRRSAKTTMSSIIICYTLYKLIKAGNPQRKFGLPDGEKIQIANVASTKDQAGVLFNMVSNFLSGSQFFKPYMDKVLNLSIKMYTPWDLEQKRSRPSIMLKAHPCSAKSIRGSGTIIAVMDELAHFDVTGGPASDDRVYTAFAPSIVTFGDEGSLISISSPLGEAGKLYSMFVDGVENQNQSYLCMQLPTWLANPDVKMSVLKNMESADPDNFWAEYGADFLASHSRSFIADLNSIKTCTDIGRLSIFNGGTGVRYYMAVDIGFIRDGFAVVVVHPQDNKIVVDYAKVYYAGTYPYEKLTKLDPDEMADYLVHIHRSFNPVGAILDQWESSSFSALLRNRGLEMECIPFDRATNSEIYQKFRNRLYQGEIRLPDEPELLRELRNLRSSSTSKYSLHITAPFGAHMDLSDALVRACYLCDRDYFTDKKSGKQAVTLTMSMSRSGRNPIASTFNRQASRIRNRLRR